MIDTVVIQLEPPIIDGLDLSKFQFGQEFGKRYYFKAVYNPNLSVDGYGPSLTYTRRTYNNQTLAIQFSAPKLLYGNNFDEVDDNDFENIVDCLKKYLMRFGLNITYEQIRQSSVRVINYSKNIILSDYCTSSMIMIELYKADVSKMIDITERVYKNGGQTLYFHTNSSQFVLYDKIQEMEVAKISDKRSADRNSVMQLDLFNQINEPALEVLRLEVRLNDKRKIKQTLKKTGFDEDISFQSLFKQDISKSIIVNYWDNIVNGLNLANLSKTKPIDSLGTIKRNNPKLSRQKALSIIGALAIVNENGSRALRNIIESKWDNKQWTRLRKDINELEGLKTNKLEYINTVEKTLHEFVKVRLCDYKALSCIVNKSKVL